jgi:hypothetical protein
MANKNIDSFLVDHEWLQAQSKQNAPFAENQSHEQLDALANAFSYSNSTDIMLEPKKVKAAVEEVIAAAKRELMMGRSIDHVERTVLANLNPSIRSVVYKEINKLASEVGLLGNVYIDPSAFSSCEDGSKVLKNNRVASFAKKMADCSGCVQNQGGFCRLYKKALVNEVPYDTKTLKQYQEHLIVAGKISPEQKIASKVELQDAFILVDNKKAQATSVVFHDESKRKAKSSNLEETVSSKVARDIASDLSKRLSAGMEPSLFKEYVSTRYASSFDEHGSVIKKYADLVGSVGKVFVELEPFASIEDARKFFAKHNPNVKYALSDKKRQYTHLDEKALGKKIISSLSEIPTSEWEKNLKRAGKNYNSKDLSVNPISVTKKAFLDVRQQKVAQAEKFEIESDIDLNGFNPKLASDAVNTRSQIEAQLRMGQPLASILKHNNRVSSTTISKLVESHLHTASVIQASLFETPCETPYKINNNAKIAAKKDCSTCPYNKGVLCTRLDRSFTVYANKSASASSVSEIKATDNKVAVKVDKNLEVELEESVLDDSISKYI